MKVILTSCHNLHRAENSLPNMQAFIKRNSKKLLKGKIAASEAESFREFAVWYNNKWRRDYPDLYNDRWKRRRLTEVTSTPRKRTAGNIVTPSPKRARVVRFQTHVPAMVRRTRSRRPMRRMRRRSRVSKKRSFKRQALRKTADPRKRGLPPAKRIRVEHDSALTNLSGNFLYAKNITQVAQGGDINQRERQIIDVQGFRLRYYLKNTANTANDPGVPPNKPLLCNMALVYHEQDGQAEGLTYKEDHFFRNNNGVSRYVKFGGIGDALTGWDKYTLPMNIDDQAVLWHTRFKLGSAQTSGNFGAGSQNTWRTISRYIKIKRRLTYTGTLAHTHQGTFWLLIWCNHIDQTPIAGQTANTFQLLGETTMFFRDPGV